MFLEPYGLTEESNISARLKCQHQLILDPHCLCTAYLKVSSFTAHELKFELQKLGVVTNEKFMTILKLIVFLRSF
jgi:hypothetical protein